MEFSTAGELLNAAVYFRTRSSQGLRSTVISTRGPIETWAFSREKSGSTAPDFTPQHRNIAVESHGSSGAGPTRLAVAQFVRVVKLVGSHPGLHFQPARTT